MAKSNFISAATLVASFIASPVSVAQGKTPWMPWIHYQDEYAESLPTDMFYVSGNELLTDCDYKTGNALSKLRYDELCGKYIQGVIDGIEYAKYRTRKTAFFCIPDNENYTFDQTQKVVIKHLKAYPEKLHHPAAALIRQAVTEAFPCKGSSK